MRGVICSAAAVALLSAAPVFGQVPAQQPQPAQPAPSQPAAQAPAQPAPQPPAQPAAQPPQPFPEGAKLAYINLGLIAQNSSEGKAASSKIEELQKKKQAELQEKNKQLQAAQQKLNSGATVLNEQARGDLQKDIDRMQREIQFSQQNAQAEVQDLTAELQEQFRKKLIPIIEGIGKERGLHVIFSAGDAGMVWASPGLDLTQEVIKRLDAARTSK